MLLTGALAPLRGFGEPGSPVTLALPPEVDTQAREAGAVELVDPEGLPLARVAWPAGVAEPLSRPDYGPFRRLHLTPAEVRERFAGRAVLVVTGALSDEQLEAARDLGPLVLLALCGHDRHGLPATALLRAGLVAADLLDAADVVAVPLTRRADDLRDRVVQAYAGSDRVVDQSELSPLPEPAPKPGETYYTYGTHSGAIGAIVRAADKAPDERGLVLFFTGLSGSGKSTLARALVDRVLEHTARTVTSLDGDVVRRNLSAGLTFSKADRETNIRRIGWVAAEIARHGGLAVCSPIAPFDETRQQVRQLVEDAGGTFFLVHVATPLEECERRDRKGLYAKARRGEIPEFTGISSPYEEPQDASVRVDTTGRTIEDALDDVLQALAAERLLDLTAEPAVERARPLSVVEQGPTPVVEQGRPSPVVEQGRQARVETPEAEAEAPLRILFVCTANICRSPYMEAAARHHLGDTSRVVVSSAGTHGFDAKPTDAAMAAQLQARSIDSSDFRSRAVTRELLDEADVVLTAEATHRTFLLEDQPEAFRKVFTLGQLAAYVESSGTTARGRALVAEAAASRGSASPGLDVADPYRRGDAAAQAAAEHIDRLLATVLPALTPED
nr:adenylyl-sulfate kinase [Nocardioides perillae]